jgi:hypothetical protein
MSRSAQGGSWAKEAVKLKWEQRFHLRILQAAGIHCDPTDITGNSPQLADNLLPWPFSQINPPGCCDGFLALFRPSDGLQQNIRT